VSVPSVYDRTGVRQALLPRYVAIKLLQVQNQRLCRLIVVVIVRYYEVNVRTNRCSKSVIPTGTIRAEICTFIRWKGLMTDG